MYNKDDQSRWTVAQCLTKNYARQIIGSSRTVPHLMSCRTLVRQILEYFAHDCCILLIFTKRLWKCCIGLSWFSKMTISKWWWRFQMFYFQDDYRQAVVEIDEKQFISLRLMVVELRNQYVSNILLVSYVLYTTDSVIRTCVWITLTDSFMSLSSFLPSLHSIEWTVNRPYT